MESTRRRLAVLEDGDWRCRTFVRHAVAATEERPAFVVEADIKAESLSAVSIGADLVRDALRAKLGESADNLRPANPVRAHEFAPRRGRPTSDVPGNSRLRFGAYRLRRRVQPKIREWLAALRRGELAPSELHQRIAHLIEEIHPAAAVSSRAEADRLTRHCLRGTSPSRIASYIVQLKYRQLGLNDIAADLSPFLSE